MARRQVLEIQCDRCNRVETKPVAANSGDAACVLTVTFKGKTISYEDLCTKCEKAVEGYFKNMTMQKDEKGLVVASAPEAQPEKKKGFFSRAVG